MRETTLKSTRWGSSSGYLVAALWVFSQISYAQAVADPLGAQLSAEQMRALSLACAKNNPVLVIDNFPRARGSADRSAELSAALAASAPGEDGTTIDLDGDDVSDVFHGEFIEILYRLEGKSTARKALPPRASLPDLTEILGRVVSDIEKKKVKYSLINLSQVTALKLSAFKADLFADDPSVPEINAGNIEVFVDKILSYFDEKHPHYLLKEMRALLTKLQKRGIPVVVAAGNAGPGHVNLFSFMPGVISVGALSPQGEPLLTSAANPFVRHWRSGVVVPVVVKGGVDLNQDGMADVLTKDLSGGVAIVDSYRAKRVSDVVREIPDDLKKWDQEATKSNLSLVPNSAINILPAGVYRVSDLAALGTTTAGTARLLKSLGEFVLKGRFDQPLQYFFDQDAHQRLVYNPAGNGLEGQLTRIPGTSFAAPRICRF